MAGKHISQRDEGNRMKSPQRPVKRFVSKKKKEKKNDPTLVKGVSYVTNMFTGKY